MPDSGPIQPSDFPEKIWEEYGISPELRNFFESYGIVVPHAVLHYLDSFEGSLFEAKDGSYVPFEELPNELQRYYFDWQLAYTRGDFDAKLGNPYQLPDGLGDDERLTEAYRVGYYD